MFKRSITVLLASIILFGFSFQAMGQTQESDVKLDCRAYTKIGFFNVDNSDMTRLHDGKYSDPVIFSIPGGVLDENSYIDIVFNGDICEVRKFDMACNKGLQPNQSMSEFEVYGYDDNLGKWSEEKETVIVNWNETEGDVIKATAILNNPINSSRVRLKLTKVNATWDTIRVQELAPYGINYNDKKIMDLSNDATVTSDIVSFVAGDINSITDKSFATEFRCEQNLTDENPATITYDFKDKYYDINAIELVSIFAPYAGVKRIDIEYKQNGKWVKLGDTITFNRPNGLGSDKFELDRVLVNKVTNGIKIIIKETYFEWSHFRISDIMVYGNETVLPSPINDKIICSQEYKMLFDGDENTYFVSKEEQLPTNESPYNIEFSLKGVYVPKSIDFINSDISSVKIGYKQNIGNDVTILKDVPTLIFSENIARVELDNSKEIDNLVVMITGALKADYKIGDMNVLAYDPYESVSSAILKFQNTKKYEDCKIAKNLVDSITNENAKRIFEKQINEIKDELLEKQNISVSYIPFDRNIEIKGWLFEETGTVLKGNIYDENDTLLQTCDVAILESGNVLSIVSIPKITKTGTYKVKITANQKELSADFKVRELSKENSILTFSIDGNLGEISTSSVNVELPEESSLKDRTPKYTLSQGAKIFYGDTLIENGITKIDFSAPVTLKVVSENREEKSYTIYVSLKQNTSSGGGSSGGGGSIGGGYVKQEVTIPNENTPEETPTKLTFKDVAKDHWAYEYINKLYQMGVVSGVEKDLFFPEGNIKREEFVKMVVFAFDIPLIESTTNFSDVKGHWSEKYINTAVENKIVNGISKNEFGIGNPITKEDLAVMIYRGIGDKLSITDISKTEKFNDDNLISDYAKKAVYTLKANGIITGDNNNFSPKKSATRSECAKIVCNSVLSDSNP